MRVRWALEYGSVGNGKWNAPIDHKLAQKPQRRQKTTSSPKNHNLAKKPQARPKTTISPKNHNRAPFAVLWAVRGRNSSYLTRSALRARATHQTLLRCPCAWILAAFPVSDTQCATRDPKTTSDPQDHKTTRKNHKRSTSQKSRKASNINGLRN